jgi:cobalamin synthase
MIDDTLNRITPLSGITGDCLGATNQHTEVVLYLTAIILSRLDLQ